MPKLKSILLVDDDPTTNYLNKKVLDRLGVTEQVLVALNGEEALQILTTECTDASRARPALIFLDINMPQMDGFEFLDAFGKLPQEQRQAVVIVMLTTSVHASDLERLKSLPIKALVNKPLTPAKVEEILTAHFSAP